MRRLSIILFSLIILSQFVFAGRYYDAKVGRFLQVDPNAHNYPDVASYAYCGNNPIKNIDPDGKNFWDFITGVTVAVGQNVNPTYQGTAVGSYSGDRGDYAAGRVVGDVASMLIGGGEMVAGSAGTGTGVAVSTTGAGAVVGVPLAVASAGVVAHGAMTTAVATSNLGSDLNALKSENVNSTSSSKSEGKSEVKTEVKQRGEPGKDGATSQHVIEKVDGKTNSVTHQVTKDGNVIHQHQTHIGKNGTQRQFPDKWIEHKKID